MANYLLITNRLKLRFFEHSDAPSLAKLISPNISRWLANWPPRLSIPEAHKKITQLIETTESKRALNVAIICKDDNQLIGALSVKVGKSNQHIGELGYWVGDAYQNQGFVSEILLEFTEIAFKQLQLTELQAGAQRENKASFALMKKIGMKFKGTKTHYIPIRNSHEEVLYYNMPSPLTP
ncbi:hypothetical protein WH96_13275 [Kiloniella spongiae]|uniref:N-acetyltransferase domain-containing protein n=1 Tax=Kiloniella spongiae TaxID=1489064 RepID=A0A0H2MC79_9PROT|nr:GNAT family N-acetyltransferase [Kiloniella spongiae]KLN60154.1 hypothetical protein WH96_13275 [Kiloniella spongiae]